MDFLDPKFQKRHHIQLVIGYIFVTIAILFATLVLLYQAYGFGLNNKGQVVQSGLIFVSSHPSGAQIYLNGVLSSSATNARLSVPSGTYTLKITRSGYRDWQRPISVIGGTVERFDYPFLFPTNLVTSPVGSYVSAPALATQSPDKRWLLVLRHTTPDLTFDEYDLTNPKAPPTVLTLPATVYTPSAASTWQAVEWSSDSAHLLLQHTYSGKTEFIVMDRTDPTKSVNLNATLNLAPSSRVNLFNGQYDHYYVYDTAAQTLQTVSLTDPVAQPLLDHVLDYKTYAGSVVLYASSLS
ncbi:MAG TPA: PEGA domain-containing protein, partial [Candidatus Saccharimonadales bacterium]